MPARSEPIVAEKSTSVRPHDFAGFFTLSVDGSACRSSRFSGKDADGGTAVRFAEMLQAGNNFLTGVAALGKTDAVNEFEVDGLRHERFARGRKHLRNAGGNG